MSTSQTPSRLESRLGRDEQRLYDLMDDVRVGPDGDVPSIRVQHVREHVAEHDPGVRGSERACGFDVLLLALGPERPQRGRMVDRHVAAVGQLAEQRGVPFQEVHDEIAGQSALGYIPHSSELAGRFGFDNRRFEDSLRLLGYREG